MTVTAIRTGRAAVLEAYEQPFQTQRFPRPEPEPGALVVDIDVATVCGSDVHVWLGHLEGVLPITPPLILGHEMTGIITDIGPGADVDSVGEALRIGDRVVWAHTPCGRCRECTIENEPVLCTNRYIAYLNDCSVAPHFTGSFAEIGYVVPRAGRLRVPDGVQSDWASAGSCALRTVVKAAEVAGAIDFTDSIVIQGAGPLGLFATAIISLHHPKHLVVVGGPADRLELAREWGATHTVSLEEFPTQDARIEQVRAITSGGATVGFELAGAPGAVGEGVELIRPHGRYVIMGTLGGAPQAIPVPRITTRGLRILGSMSGAIGDYHTAMQILDRFQERFAWDRMLGRRYGLDDVAGAMGAMLRMEEIKPVIDPRLP